MDFSHCTTDELIDSFLPFTEFTLDELTAPPFSDISEWDENPDDEEMDTDTLDHSASYYADLL